MLLKIIMYAVIPFLFYFIFFFNLYIYQNYYLKMLFMLTLEVCLGLIFYYILYLIIDIKN